MPKRKNPFGDSTPLQLKTHVGFKEAASEEEKQEVYEKTRALLFQGANPHAQVLPVVNGHSEIKPAGPNGFNGAAQKSGLLKYFSNGHTTNSKLKQCSSNTCTVCHRTTVTLLGCSFCDRRVCGGCLRACCICSGTFCQFCSVLNYDEVEVRSFCLSCLPVQS